VRLWTGGPLLLLPPRDTPVLSQVTASSLIKCYIRLKVIALCPQGSAETGVGTLREEVSHVRHHHRAWRGAVAGRDGEPLVALRAPCRPEPEGVHPQVMGKKGVTCGKCPQVVAVSVVTCGRERCGRRSGLSGAITRQTRDSEVVSSAKTGLKRLNCARK